MSDYVSEIRKLVGTRPLVLCSAGVIVLDHMNRVLLQHRTDNDMWCLPGGASEPGERLEDAAARELQEEVGLRCGSLELFGIYAGPEMYYRYPNGHEVHNVSVIYLCRESLGEIQVDPAEAKDAAFFSVADIPAAISPPNRPAIEDLRRRCRDATGAEAAGARSLFDKVDCLSLPVPDLTAALEFYRDKLGHSLIWRTEAGAGLRLSGSEAELVLRTDTRPPETDLKVASADDAAARFVAAGGTIVVSPFDIKIGRCVVVADPWGNELVLLDQSKGLLCTDADGNVIP